MTSFVVPHDPIWKAAFECEAQAISTVIGQGDIALHHIGSTAIPGILAKPIIDLLGVVPSFERLDARSIKMETLGYEVMGEFGIEGRRYFRKIDDAGQRTHHLHVYQNGSAHIDRHLAFRDYLRNHPEVAQEYSDLKASLNQRHPARMGRIYGRKRPLHCHFREGGFALVSPKAISRDQEHKPS